jgi:hypothetical protein
MSKPKSKYTIKDRHYVGADGFIVPANFEEYHLRYPDFVKRWIKKHVFGKFVATPADASDLESELTLHLLSLPAASKFRRQGKTDRIQCFNPNKLSGATSGHFFYYIHICLQNRVRTMVDLEGRDALRDVARNGHAGCLELKSDHLRNINLSELDDRALEGNSPSADEMLYYLSQEVRLTVDKKFELVEKAHFLKDFWRFVEKNEPEMLTVIEAIATTAFWVEAEKITKQASPRTFEAQLNRLRYLMECFASNCPVQNRRKVYAIKNRVMAA